MWALMAVVLIFPSFLLDPWCLAIMRRRKSFLFILNPRLEAVVPEFFRTREGHRRVSILASASFFTAWTKEAF